MGRRVVIIEENCVGCGSCETTCPEVFKLDEEADVSRVILAEGGPEKAIQAAMDHCLASCIIWEED